MAGDPLWYKDAVIYELHVKSFYDSDGDGIGDFRGLTEKLDYLEGLGVTAVWLLPFYPSPLKDDGYDIADYFNINPSYGTLRDFKRFLREAHKKGIRVITELVLNHTSDAHSWFRRARKAKPGTSHRDFYVWSDTAEKYSDARIIFKDFEHSNWTWDPVANAYFWHRFYHHQPDLNYDNPDVKKAVMKAVSFWFDMGVDGLRMDAVPYLFEREGTNCENLSETYVFLKELRAFVDDRYGDKMLLAEANQWPEDAAAYFGEGDCCHMCFHFPLMPRIFMASWMEDAFPLIDILDQTPEIPENCQWTLFLRNHDELTLEMVTDEERDYMYRVYASDPVARINLGIRRRLAPLLGNHRRKIELMKVLLFSLPGTPVLYYGDEIGMGDNYYLGDRDGVRTPMQWSTDRNAGFSRANPQRLFLPVIIDPEHHYEAVNVETQERNQASLLWWTKRLISMRKRLRAFGRGGIRFIATENPKILAFTRSFGDEHILVVVNLSRFPQVAELDLSEYSGRYPEEVFSRNPFPSISGDGPYVLTLGFYDYYWFRLRPVEVEAAMEEKPAELPLIKTAAPWAKALAGDFAEGLENVLPAYMTRCRWFGGKARKVQWVRVSGSVTLGRGPGAYHIIFIKVRYTEGEPETYQMPLAFEADEAEAALLMEDAPAAVVARVETRDGAGFVFDAVYDEGFRRELMRAISARRGGSRRGLSAYPGSHLRRNRPTPEAMEKTRVLKAEQSNTSILYGTEYILKLFRKLDRGINPDLELSRFLTEKAGFPNIPPFGGAVEVEPGGAGRKPAVLGILNGFVANQGDFWSFALDSASSYFERAVSQKEEACALTHPPVELSGLLDFEATPLFRELAGGVFLEMVTLLGRRTAEMHLALASDPESPDFSPEPFSLLYQRSLFQSMQSAMKRSLGLLKKSAKGLSEEAASEAAAVLDAQQEIMGEFKKLVGKKLRARKIRIHGDYHLGQVLYTGNDFFIIDFEGEPASPLSERRLKKSPLRDVAGMMRSFQYAAYSALLRNSSDVRPEDRAQLTPLADLWYRSLESVFLRSYFAAMKGSNLIPEEVSETEVMLRAFLLEKAVYEAGYELNSRPDWVVIPLRGIRNLLEG